MKEKSIAKEKSVPNEKGQNGKGSNGKGKKQFQFKLKINIWSVIGFIFIVMFVVPLLLSFFETKGSDGKVDLTETMNRIKKNEAEKITIEGNRIVYSLKDGTLKYSAKEGNDSFSDLLQKYEIKPETVRYTIVDQSLTKAFGDILSVVLPLILMAVFFFFILKAQSRGAQDIFSFGRSKARLFAKGKQSTTFADIAGVEDAKKELMEVVDFLKNPAKYIKIGARTPKGVLLFGPAGVGKTLLARAVAGEAGVPFFSMAGSEFMEMLVGVGASRVRDLFAQAKAASPAIIFIDEIDAIGRQRGRGVMGGHDEREQTLNQILVEMDGFTPNDNVCVLAATNRGDLLDPALLRPGRFDRRVTLDMPDKDGRLAILKIHARGKKMAGGIDWERIADRTVGFSGADLENMLNEAAIQAARLDKTDIEMTDIEESATKVKLGPAKKRAQSDEDKNITAYHEAGHAVVSHLLPTTDPVQRVSIVARGMSLGHTEISPSAANDRTHETKTRLLQAITYMMGGRAAEEVVFDEMTAGASSDIQNSTKYARAMVVDFGMSTLGPINFGAQYGLGEFGALDWYEASQVSPAMQEKIDNEVKRIIDACHKDAVNLVKKNRGKIDAVVKVLLEKETIDREEFEKIVGKKSGGVN